jgi:dipeptidase E
MLTGVEATTAGELEPAERTILALGGHEFSRKRGNEAIRDYILTMAGAPVPRVCLLPTASGDPADQIAAFRASFGPSPCVLSHLSLFRLEHERLGDIERHLLNQDLIYVGGGSMLNLLAIWRAHGIDRILRDCWQAGIVLVGQSAGAMCWFEWGVSRSAGATRLVEGLGLVPGILSVHYHRDASRRTVLHEAIGERGGPGHGLDDCAGVVIGDGEVRGAITGLEGATAWRVARDAAGRVRETALAAVALPSPRTAIDEVGDDVMEMRQLRATRASRR